MRITCIAVNVSLVYRKTSFVFSLLLLFVPSRMASSHFSAPPLGKPLLSLLRGSWLPHWPSGRCLNPQPPPQGGPFHYKNKWGRGRFPPPPFPKQERKKRSRIPFQTCVGELFLKQMLLVIFGAFFFSSKKGAHFFLLMRCVLLALLSPINQPLGLTRSEDVKIL